MRAFAVSPAVVAPRAAGRLVVQLFDRILADVGEEQGAGPAARGIVDAEPPRIAQPDRPHFGRAAPGRERIARRDVEPFRILVADVDVDPQQLPEQAARRLRLMRGVVHLAAVARSDGTASRRRRTRDCRCSGRSPGVGRSARRWTIAGRTVSRDRPPADRPTGGSARPRSSRPCRQTIRRTGRLMRSRGKREAHEAAFTVSGDGVGEIQERAGQQRPVLDDPDDAFLLHNELHRGIGSVLDEGHRMRQTGHIHLTAELRERGRRDQQERSECGDRTVPRPTCGVHTGSESCTTHKRLDRRRWRSV